MKNLSKCDLECLIIYKYADFAHAMVPKIHLVPKNDTLLVSDIEIDSRGFYVCFTRDGLLGQEKHASLLLA
jgi:hypothetical protein